MTVHVGYADKAWATVIKTRDNYTCRWCGVVFPGKSRVLQAAHIISRTVRITRWDPQNGIALCAKCHFRAHIQPLDFYDWIRSWMNEQELSALRERSRTVGDKEAVEQSREAILDAYCQIVGKERKKYRPEKKRAASRRYHHRHKDVRNAKHKIWYKKNKSEIRKRRQRYYELNRPKIRAAQKEWADANRQHLRDYWRKYNMNRRPRRSVRATQEPLSVGLVPTPQATQ